jgi:hypothetical protein
MFDFQLLKTQRKKRSDLMKKLALGVLALSFLATLVPSASAQYDHHHHHHCWYSHHHRHCN